MCVYSDSVFAASGVEYVSGAVHHHLHQRICVCVFDGLLSLDEIVKPSSEKERNEGTRNERLDWE